MNFKNMPELQWEYGYYGVVGVDRDLSAGRHAPVLQKENSGFNAITEGGFAIWRARLAKPAPEFETKGYIGGEIKTVKSGGL